MPTEAPIQNVLLTIQDDTGRRLSSTDVLSYLANATDFVAFMSDYIDKFVKCEGPNLPQYCKDLEVLKILGGLALICVPVFFCMHVYYSLKKLRELERRQKDNEDLLNELKILQNLPNQFEVMAQQNA